MTHKTNETNKTHKTHKTYKSHKTYRTHRTHSTHKTYKTYKTYILLLAILFATACGDETISNKFCNLPAQFTFTPVQSISQLYSSCESMGEWCSITVSKDGKSYLFTKPDGSQGRANKTALSSYTNFIMGLSGFIVGLPNIPEVGEMFSVVTCYDLACRNCYEDFGITRDLQFQGTDGKVSCSRCKRHYDLNNTGQVVQGNMGQPLYRYRVYYGNSTLSINF